MGFQKTELCKKCGCEMARPECWENGGLCYLCASVPVVPCKWDENELGLDGYKRKETV